MNHPEALRQVAAFLTLSISWTAGPVSLGGSPERSLSGEEPGAKAGEPAAAGADKASELLPFLPWAQTGPLAALGGAPSEPVPLPPRGNLVLKGLREKAGTTWGFTLRAFAAKEDVAAFESSFPAAARALKASDPAEARALAQKLSAAADSQKLDSGYRRLLLARALALALLAKGGDEEDLDRISKKLHASLSTEVPADFTAGVLAAEALASRASVPEPLLASRREVLKEARLDLFRFQVRNGYLDEAGETLSRMVKDAGAGAGEAEIKGLRRRLDSRMALRERYRKLLREAEAKPEDGARFRDLALFMLWALHDDPLASAAASRSDHPVLKAYADAGGLGAGRTSMARAELLVDLISIAPAADRPGLAALARERIDDLSSGATGPEVERLKTLRARLEESLQKSAPSLPAVFVRVPANSAWAPSGFHARKGRRYHITAEGKWSSGGKADQRTEVDASGGAVLPPAQGRIPAAALVVQVGPSTETIFIGKELFLSAPESGEIFFSMNDAFREFEDNSGSLLVRIEVSPGTEGPPPRRPADFPGRWVTSGQAGTSRDLNPDGTCRTGVLHGTWVARNVREAVLRWPNGAVERMTITVPGSTATLIGQTSRTFTLTKESSEERKKKSP